MNRIIATHNLSKRYGNIDRVKRLHLSVQEGEIYGFLGPNGAGKTTTLKMILGLVKPTEGKVFVFGKELEANRRRILSQIGSLIESPSFYGHLTGLENMRVIQKLRDLPDQNIAEALRIVRLDKHKDKKVEQYSLGMKQRLGIAMALASFPRLLILDEPTNGLDPAGIGEIRELIRSLPQRYEMTVLLSSHLLSEIEQIATSVGIIHDGSMLYQGRMEELFNHHRPAIAFKTTNNRLARELLAQHGLCPALEGDRLVLNNVSDEQVAEANRILVAARMDVLRIEEQTRNLESIFLEMTGRESGLP